MDLLDSLISNFWSRFLNWKWSSWPMLEAYLAATSFFTFISIFRGMDQIHIFRNYRFDRSSTPVLEAKGLLSFANGILPAVIYLLLIHVYHFFVTKAPMMTESPTFSRIFLETLIGVVLYDFIFFWIHLLMHHTPQLQWFHQHHIHHSQSRLLASEVQHHSFVDAFLQVTVNIIVQNVHLPGYGRKHSLSRLLHNIVITYMLTEIHAGYDAWWSLHNIFPRIIGGAKRHELHHRYGNLYYQQFFMYLDDLLITPPTTWKTK